MTCESQDDILQNMNLDEKLLLSPYISEGQRDLLHVGFHLLEHVVGQDEKLFADYSFVVFPFAKAYEGFLKQAFLDAGFITQKDFVSNYFRVGKAMSPNLVRKLGNRSVYKQICDRVNCELSEHIWQTWKAARNEVFHYFPHNIRSLTLAEAKERVALITDSMKDITQILVQHQQAQ